MNETLPAESESTPRGQITLSDVKKMSDKMLRYRVAELVGWKLWLEKRGEYLWVIPQLEKEREPWKSYRDAEKEKERYSPLSFSQIDYHKHIYSPVDKIIPDYPHDLNAVHEVEAKHISERGNYFYLDALDKITNGQKIGFSQAMVCATARQRCEALVLCLSERGDNSICPQSSNSDKATGVSK